MIQYDFSIVLILYWDVCYRGRHPGDFSAIPTKRPRKQLRLLILKIRLQIHTFHNIISESKIQYCSHFPEPPHSPRTPFYAPSQSPLRDHLLPTSIIILSHPPRPLPRPPPRPSSLHTLQDHPPRPPLTLPEKTPSPKLSQLTAKPSTPHFS